MFRELCDFLFGEGPERDGAEESRIASFLSGKFDGFLGNARCRAEGHDGVVGILHVARFVAHLLLGDFLVLRLEVKVAHLHDVRLEFERGNHLRPAFVYAVAVGGPGAFLCDFLFRAAGLEGREHHLFHHLADDTVREHHHRCAPAEGKRKGEVHEVGHFLHRCRGQHNHVVVAVAAAAGGLVVVALGRLDGTEARTAALHVHDEAGDFGTGHIADTLLHQSDARRCRRGHHAFARTAAAVEHVDGGHFAFGLHDHHARGLPWLQLGERFEHLTLGSNRITEVAVAAAADGGACNGFVTFEKQDFVFFVHRTVRVKDWGQGPAAILNCFFAVNTDAAIGTDNGAGRTADAAVRHFLTKGVALVVHLVGGKRKRFGGAGHNAKAATLAPVRVNDQGSFNFAHAGICLEVNGALGALGGVYTL